ncbi:hypothetical protein HZS_99, partial [Henneguya salminicola]
MEAIKSCDEVYLESYTSACADSLQTISEFLNKNITIANRQDVENYIDYILNNCQEKKIALIIIGDPLSATTHTDLMCRAKRGGIKVELINNASIITAVSACGLQLYRFGETVSIVSWTENWQPTSFFDKINENFQRNLHTLCLLDIKLNELAIEGIMRNKPIFQPNYFQSASEAAIILLKIIQDTNKLETQFNGNVKNKKLCGSDL